jgi:superfamily I DNA/RNA helicase
MDKYPDLYPTAGRNALAKGDLKTVFPRSLLKSNPDMNESIAKEARAWLCEPQFTRDQRVHLKHELDDCQLELVMSRTSTGYRRIKGPPGSGKSLVLAGRAAELSTLKKDVLVMTYNITLINYLKGLSVRWCGEAAKRNITWLNFHRWCRRVAEQTENIGEYFDLWKEGADDDRILASYLPEKVKKWIDEDVIDLIPRYDAIFVDEGQDFRREWLIALRKVLKPGGEMVLVIDSAQDIFKRAEAWNGWDDNTMKGCGFNGPWKEMSVSYRLPPKLVSHVEVFAKRFLPNAMRISLHRQSNELDLFPCKLRWVQIERADDAAEICCEEMLRMLFESGKNDLAVAELTFITDSQKVGMRVEEKLFKKNIQSISTYSEDDREARKKKMAFFMDSQRVKLTTIHSFKGWETRALVLYIGKASSDRDKAIVYTAMTRLRRNDRCSYLTVVCSAQELKGYGKTWADSDISEDEQHAHESSHTSN